MWCKKLVLLAVLFFSGTSLACDIPQNCRVKNQSPGYCAWACLETMGRFHDIKQLHDLLETRKGEKDFVVMDAWGNVATYKKNLGYGFTVRAKLTDLKVRFWMQEAGGSDRNLLRYAGSHGCLVAVNAGALKDVKIAHALVLTEYNEKTVEYFDPNHPEFTWVVSRKWFDYYWTGLVVVVEKGSSR